MHLTKIVTAAAVVLLSGIIFAGNSFGKEIIPMNEPAYAAHTKGIVQFAHKKHVAEYKLDCGECHHDAKGAPLKLKKGDAVQRCIECHPKAVAVPKGKDAPKLSHKEELAYHTVAIHNNCKGCHKEYNKKNKTKAAPTTCSKCHPKK